MQPTLIQAPAIVAALPPAAGQPPSLFWGIPFLGVLLSVALFPMLAERV